MAKKTFTNIGNPVDQFLTAKIHEDLKERENPYKLESKSKRVQLLMRPSVYEAIKKDAYEKRLSLNGLIHEILELYVKEINSNS